MKHYFEFTPDQRQFCEQMPSAFCVFQMLEGRCRMLLISQGMCDLLGLAREEIQRMFDAADMSGLFSPADAADAETFFQEIIAAPEVAHHTALHLHACGGKWISCDTKTNRQPDGTPLLYLTCEDVTAWERERLERESTQRRKDSLLERILATTGTALFWKDAQRRFVGVNQAFLDYYGFADESELLGKTDEEVGWHTDPQPYQDDEWRVLREGKSTRRVPGKCMARGELRAIVASKSPMYVDGKIVGLVGSFEDVTNETLQREEIARLNLRLEQKVAEYDMLMEATGVSIAKVHLDGDFTLEWGNEEFYRATGYSKEEYDRLFHGKLRLYFQDHPEIHHQLQQALDTALAQRKESFELAILMPCKEGKRWKKGMGTFTDYDPVTGRPAFIYAVYADVTGVVDMQEKLRKAKAQEEQEQLLTSENQRLQSIIDNVPSGIGVCHLTDRKTEHLVLNRYFMKMVAKDADSDEAGNIINVLHPDDIRRCGEDMHRFLAGDGPLDGVYRFLRRDANDYFWVHIEGNLVEQPDGSRIAYFAYTNVDKLKKVELALKTSQRIYDEVLRAANIVAWEYDLTTHAVTMSGDEFTREDAGKFGLPQFIEHAPESLIPYIDSRDVPQFVEMYDQVKAGNDAS
jgi:PAS domain S-box-containing protein